MDIFIPNKKLWIPDNAIADSLASPIGIARMIRRNRRIRCLTPHRVMMGAAGSIVNDETSYYFDGTAGDEALQVADHIDWLPGSAFTWELFIRFDSISAGWGWIMQQAVNSSNEWGLRYQDDAGTHQMGVWSRNGGTIDIDFWQNIAPTTFTIGQWYHLTWVKDGNDWETFVDGVSNGTTTDTTTIVDLAAPINIGNDRPLTGGGDIDGRFDEIRFSNIVRYNIGFTPTITEFKSDSNTKLLIHCGENIVSGITGSGATFTDSTGVHTVTELNGAIRDEAEFKF